MKLFSNTLTILLLFTVTIFSGDKKVLVEVFTNSHCPLCPPAHQSIIDYTKTANGNDIIYIFYHIRYPYSTDQLYQDNTMDSQSKNSYYGPFTSTPQAFFDGVHVANSYSTWGNTLDGKVSEPTNFDIALSGNFTENDFSVSALITKTTELNANDLTFNFVVVEDVMYQGNNGISDHKNVMRAISKIDGEPFSVNLNESVNLSHNFTKSTNWNTDNLKVVTYIQSSSSKDVYQAAIIDYNSFNVTSVDSENNLTAKFSLEQNYPNPFNPSTTIRYSIPAVKSQNSLPTGRQVAYVQLKVFDVLGNEVNTLVNEQKTAGNYTVNFDASDLSSGIYFYKLTAGNFVETKKMIILK